MLTQRQDELSENLHRREEELQLAGRRLCRGPFRANPCSLQVLSELVRHLGMTIIIITDEHVSWGMGHPCLRRGELAVALIN